MKKIVVEIPVNGMHCGRCRMISSANPVGPYCAAFYAPLSHNTSGWLMRCNECLCAKHYDANERVEPR